MKTRMLATLLLAAVTVVGLMGGTSSAKGGTVGVITVNRAITLNIENLGPDTSRYYGVITHSDATVDLVARARIRKGKKASLTRRTRGRIKKAPEKKQNNARAQAEEFCYRWTRSNDVNVVHRPAQGNPFQIGKQVPNIFFAYSVIGARAPRNDIIEAYQFGTGSKDGFGREAVQTGPWTWSVICSAVSAFTLAP